MRLVGRRVLGIAFLLALLTFVFSGASDGAATGPTANVVVVTSGVVPEPQAGGKDYSYADYGLVLRNRSSTRDAINVTFEVEGVDASGRSLTDDYGAITLIPAGASFVISGALIWRGSLGLAEIETEVRVGQTAPRRRRLPLVKGVSVTNSGGVVGSFTNPYKKALPESATIYGVVLDSQGRIVGAGYDLTDAATRPGATMAFDIRKTSITVHRDAVASAKVSVDPCGYLAFTRDCPVPGARN